MDVRIAALETLIKVLEKGESVDKVMEKYFPKVFVPSELYNLVSGVIKYKLTFDFYIQSISSRKIKSLSYQVINALRLAIYEIEHLKTPDFAVLNSYVEIIKKVDKKSAPFVNAILRNYLRKRNEIKLPEIEQNPVYAISVKYSHPEWMVENWIRSYGIEDTVKICKYNNLVPKLVIRVNTLKISKEKLTEFFREHNVSYSDDRFVEECLILHHPGNVKEIPGYHQGYWVVQGKSSSLVSKVLDPQEGEAILDFCAAPGGKTTHIAALMNNKGKITAVDLSDKRLGRLRDNLIRLGADIVEIEVGDAAKYTSKHKFDRILIDAPCSNTGVLGKRIDARWNKFPEDVKNLAKLQLEILNNAAKLIKEGGIITYSTCSIEHEENKDVIEKFLLENKDFKPCKIAPYFPWEISEDKGYYQILQSRHNIDGFFIAKIKKV